MRVAISRRDVVKVGRRAAIGIEARGSKRVEARIDVERIDASSVVIALHESEDMVAWTPLGLSQSVSAPGAVTLIHPAVSKRFVRAQLEPVGSEGQGAAFTATLEATTD
jgi:hypothetical protein